MKKKRNAMWRGMSGKFYDEYTRTQDIAMTLGYVFWRTLPESVEGNWQDGGEYLNEIYRYSYVAVLEKYQESRNGI